MVRVDRNTFIDGPWILKKLEDREICDQFDCGDADLNEYFRVDALAHKQELLTQTYCLQLDENPTFAVALLDFCNDAVQLQKMDDDLEIADAKRYPSLPAVKLTRFGVDREFQGLHIGSHVMNMLKMFFTSDNRTGCRFITVDSYNEPRVVNFYQKNDFRLLTDKDKKRDTRSMFFDLKRFEPS